ncbi:MAG: HupE/UreJ family protein [Alphaproteobacteria bacterium GM7ARS4]|nr:HupE/UreJ family protein [Alphaproteobacteria bacterium GM7ARS4]
MSFLSFSQRVVTFFLATLCTLCLWAWLAVPAFAHHVGGALPFSDVSSSPLIQGFLSGLAHPFLDPPHGLLIMATALVAAQATRLSTLPAILALSTWLGATCMTFLFPIISMNDAPLLLTIGVIALIGLSVTLVIRPTLVTSMSLMALGVFILGLSHSGLYAMEWIGSETTPILAYLGGLALLHYGITYGLAWLIQRIGHVMGGRLIGQRYGRMSIEQTFYRLAFGLVICGAILSSPLL